MAMRRLQDWTTQVSEDAEGVVSFQYRTKPDDPPDVQTIQKQMAIVAWQPGPNRIVQVPDTVSHLSQHALACSLQRAARHAPGGARRGVDHPVCARFWPPVYCSHRTPRCCTSAGHTVGCRASSRA